jgi:hypothetical protein
MEIVMINGDLKSLTHYRKVWVSLAQTSKYAPYVNSRDVETFLRRVENEGITFLTQVLPLLGKALDGYFSSGVFICPPDFKRSDTGVPLFIEKAFNCALEGDSAAVDCVRQLSYVFYKLEVAFDDARTKEVLDEFIQIDTTLPNSDTYSSERVVETAKSLIKRVLCNIDPYDIRPRHSTGATSCRTKNSDKWAKLRYSRKLDDVYPYSSHFFLSPTHLSDELRRLGDCEELDPCARVCLVPKDSRGPRVISCEPAEFMYIQQGLMTIIYEGLARHNLTRGLVNFTDQNVNRDLARKSSLNGELATLDLSEASDRVSLELVRVLFPDNWFECLSSCRSEETRLPDGRRIVLRKFAPMGSSCCFPIEALIFWAISTAATLTEQSFKPSPCEHLRYEFLGRSTWRVWNTVFVYGDDIICPASSAEMIISALELVGLKVNLKKCFIDGPFRESCGGDYHLGNDVAPIRFKKPFNKSSLTRVAHVDFLNLLTEKFGPIFPIISMMEEYWGQIPRSHRRVPLALVTKEHALHNEPTFRKRFNKSLQRTEYRIPQPSTAKFFARQPDWIELLRSSLSKGSSVHGFETFEAKASIGLKPGEYVVPNSTKIKWEWVYLG